MHSIANKNGIKLIFIVQHCFVQVGGQFAYIWPNLQAKLRNV